ncbi:hypothetical protein BJ944DRAFT_245898 [Cunninghamella echinulata]|nr:hypothetical protein BJ944DRAFT_245898 [Cunninghamella echinulata]
MVTELNMKRTTQLSKSKNNNNKLNKQCNAESPHQKSYDTSIFGGVFLVSDTLYFEVPQSISDNDILNLLSLCQPIMIQRNKHHDHIATGWIRFSNKEQADRAYTLYDGLVLKNNHRLQLYITPDGVKDQEPSAPIFQVANLPQWITNEKLFNLFRPYGPIRLCKIIVEKDHSFNGTALLQYFDENDANTAKMIMENKYLDKKAITIFPLVSSKSSQSSASTNQHSSSKSESNSVIDYTNLYIKNLDLAAKSNDLFCAFRTYGRIISARVMKNPETKQSRGYGFVSFSQPDEAKNALEKLNGSFILSKPIVIAFHEPKKRSQGTSASTTTTTTSNNNNNNNNHSSPPSLSSPHQQQKINRSPAPSIENNYHRATATTTTHYQSSATSTPSMTSSSPLPPSYNNNNNKNMTAASTNEQMQRERIRAAILSVIDKKKELDQLEYYVDKIMTLRQTSRMLCLFNPSYLITKLDEVKSSMMMMTTPTSYPYHNTPATAINYTSPKTPNLIQHDEDDHHSNASSSSTSGSSSPVMSTNSNMVTTNMMETSGDMDQHQFITRFVASMKNLSLLQQKQQLGDLLFPYVKATGVKQASKITIQLLDTQPLDKLAYSMQSTELLKPLVDKASNTLTQQQKFIKAIMQK